MATSRDISLQKPCNNLGLKALKSLKVMTVNGDELGKFSDFTVFTGTGEIASLVMGASRGLLLNEWLSSYTKQKTEVPVLVIPIGGPQKNQA